jgi:nucleotide-binding universal stress UspA family protein
MALWRFSATRSRPERFVLAGHPARTVLKLAGDLGADLIVVGASGHSALYDRMIGSRAQKILHHATCPVLVVK